MNGLGLRINRGGGGKSKNSIAFSPIQIPNSLFENAGNICIYFILLGVLV